MSFDLSTCLDRTIITKDRDFIYLFDDIMGAVQISWKKQPKRMQADARKRHRPYLL